MKQFLLNTDVRHLSGKRNGPVPKPTNEDLNIAEERERIAGMIRRSGGSQDEAVADKLTSGLTRHQVVEESDSVRTLLETPAERPAQSGRVSGYAAIDSVRREDPW